MSWKANSLKDRNYTAKKIFINFHPIKGTLPQSVPCDHSPSNKNVIKINNYPITPHFPSPFKACTFQRHTHMISLVWNFWHGVMYCPLNFWNPMFFSGILQNLSKQSNLFNLKKLNNSKKSGYSGFWNPVPELEFFFL